MDKNIFTKRFIILIVILSFLSCFENDKISITSNVEVCEELSNLGKILLDTDSKNFIPYPDSTKKIIFKDLNGEELIGIVDYYGTSFYSATTGALNPCSIDSSLAIRFKWKPEFKRMDIDFQEIDVRLTIDISPNISNNTYEEKLLADYCRITLRTPIDNNFVNSQMSIIVNPRNHPMPRDRYSDFQEFYEIHDKPFQNVYISEIDNIDEFEIIYNSELGIIGIKSISNPMIDFVFDRIEL